MRLTHLGHSTVLVETDSVRVLIDPGNFTSAWRYLTEIDLVIVTHAHPDHVDPEWVPSFIAGNPQARWLVEPGVRAIPGLDDAQSLAPGTITDVCGLTVEAVGGNHAVIHRDIPRIGNVGVVLREADGPRFFHPGDALDAIPADVFAVGVPAHGPWCAMKEIIDFTRRVGAARGFLIHDGLINERGWALSFSRLQEMTNTEFTDLRSGHPLQI